jgi:ribosomal-protein-alanine N-acetyltransferase
MESQAGPAALPERAGVRDLGAVHTLERAVFREDAYGYVDVLLLLLAPGMINLKLIGPGETLVGFVSGGRLLHMGRTWIMTIGIHPDHQRRGLGRHLLEACEALLPDREVFLTVRESNHRAMRLYQLAGYYQVGTRPGYYTGGEAGIEMRKVRETVGTL